MKFMKETKHISVLLEEAILGLHIGENSIVVDATLGGGGHTREILSRVLPGGKVIAIDADRNAITLFQERASTDEFLSQALRDGSLVLVHKNYSEIGTVLEENGIQSVDAILADLGFSSDQIEEGTRGLSFMQSGPLDMRLNQETTLTAQDIVNTFSLDDLTYVLREYGGENEAHHIAMAVVMAREKQLLTTTDELRDIVEAAYPKGKRFKMKIHPATKTFQALRIRVNQELKHLGVFLKQAAERLVVGGRIAIITFHSGEDRIVKQFFKQEAQGCICPAGFPVCVCGQKSKINILTKKPIVPSEREIEGNPRARSAKLRIAEKL